MAGAGRTRGPNILHVGTTKRAHLKRKKRKKDRLYFYFTFSPRIIWPYVHGRGSRSLGSIFNVTETYCTINYDEINVGNVRRKTFRMMVRLFVGFETYGMISSVIFVIAPSRSQCRIWYVPGQSIGKSEPYSAPLLCYLCVPVTL